MRRYFLRGGDLAGIFLHQVLHSLHADPAALGRVEESVFMAGEGSNAFSYLQIPSQRFFHFRTEIDNHFISAFAGHFDSVVLKINVFNIKAHTFRHADPRSQKQSYDSQVSFFCFFIEHTFLSGEMIAAVFDIIQKHGDFVRVQTDDAFLMDLGNVHKDCRIGVDHFPFVIVSVKAAQSGNLAFQAPFAVGFHTFAVLVDFKIFLIFLDIQSLYLVQNAYVDIPHGFTLKRRIVLQKKLKEDADVVCVGYSCFRCCCGVYGTEIVPAERRQGFQYLTETQCVFNICMFMISLSVFHKNNSRSI